MTKLEAGLIIPDCHHPYSDMKAWRLMLKAAKIIRPKWIVVLGDFGDFYAVSSFAKDPSRATQLDTEVLACNKRFDEVDSLGASEKHFISGNHEFRLERYLKDKAEALFDTVKVEKLFRLKERGWTYTPYREDLKLGAVYFTHDTGSTTGRLAAYKALDTYQHSIITGHTHRLVQVVEGNATGTQIVSAQFGWLGDIKQIDYMHKIKARKDWALGFGVGYRRNNGFIYFSAVPMVEYSCCVEGRLITL